jgi:hypothetical protein
MDKTGVHRPAAAVRSHNSLFLPRNRREMDRALTTGIALTNVGSAIAKPLPVVGNGLGHAIEAFGKLLELIKVRVQRLQVTYDE